MISADAYLGICHSAARMAGWRLTDWVPASVTPSFHRAGLERRGTYRVVACHATVPLPAIGESYAPRQAATFTPASEPRLAAALTTVSRLRVLTAAELATPLASIDLSALAAAEHAQIAYWDPPDLAALVFNEWD
ncbi:hypothetical protein ACFO4E_13410 [Nocardiopsis mangrovi]|uniref:Uncharacterized protein n=1 Tax=Nocardiopsis mangrovi TaxID=1179818 RepID=A0ABV9DVD7_9ACTN